MLGAVKTNDVGVRAEGAVMAALIRAGYTVLLPFGVQRYDLVIHSSDGYSSVQCKSGVLRAGAVQFRAFSFGPGRPRAHYQGVVDLFGVYCHENGECYLVPVAEVGTSMGSLRIEPARNNQSKGVRLAADYRI